MAARAYWQGHIRLALVSIAVEIYAATQSGARISFRQIHEPTGKPIAYEKVADGVGPVDREDIIRGFEISRGNYVLLEDAEIESVKIESKKTLELVQFVSACEIDPLYFEKPYYVAPADDLAEEAFIVLRDALREAGKVGLGQLSVRGQEKLVALKPCGKGMLLETLRYADEVKRGQAFFAEIDDLRPGEELLDLATTLIEKRTAPFDPREFRDRYSDALKDLIERKAKSRDGRAIIEEEDEPSPRSGSNVIDLMAALRKSLDSASGGSAGEKAKPAKAASKRKPAAKSSARATRARKEA